MNHITRRMALSGLILPLLAACGAGHDSSSNPDLGQLSLPLAAQGPSGVSYRLRNAIFDIYSTSSYYNYGTAGTFGGPFGSPSNGIASAGFGGTGGAGGPGVITLNGEDDPNAGSISVSIENGSYVVVLRPGWRFEKVDGGVATPVEAQLLSTASVWVYVSPHSTTWASFQFGIGDRALWFNGDLNINVNVYEDPGQFYGSFAGFSAAGGAPGAGGSAGPAGSGGL